MYAWMWHHLPGPTPVRVMLAGAAALIAVAVLFVWVFPWVGSLIEIDGSQVPRGRAPVAGQP